MNRYHHSQKILVPRNRFFRESISHNKSIIKRKALIYSGHENFPQYSIAPSPSGRGSGGGVALTYSGHENFCLLPRKQNRFNSHLLLTSKIPDFAGMTKHQPWATAPAVRWAGVGLTKQSLYQPVFYAAEFTINWFGRIFGHLILRAA